MLGFRRFFITSMRQYSSRKQGTDTGSWGESLRDNMGAAGTWDSIYNCYSPNKSLHFDWFFGYNHMRSFLHSLICELAPQKYTGPPLHLIDLGCGTSDVGLGIYRDSPVPVLMSCIDRSAPAIVAMNNILTNEPPIIPRHPDSCLQFIEGDATDLHGFPSASVSLVLDKGTSDSLLRSSRIEAHRMVKEVLRILRPKGKLVQLTDEDPDARLHFLEEAGVGQDVTFHNLGDRDDISYYAYIVTPSPCFE